MRLATHFAVRPRVYRIHEASNHGEQDDQLRVGPISQALCGSNVIGGNLEANNNGGAASIVANTISGNLQANNNSGATEVSSNTVTGNLQCDNNSSITGGGNTAKQKQGQCSGF